MPRREDFMDQAGLQRKMHLRDPWVLEETPGRSPSLPCCRGRAYLGKKPTVGRAPGNGRCKP